MGGNDGMGERKSLISLCFALKWIGNHWSGRLPWLLFITPIPLPIESDLHYESVEKFWLNLAYPMHSSLWLFCCCYFFLLCLSNFWPTLGNTTKGISIFLYFCFPFWYCMKNTVNAIVLDSGISLVMLHLILSAANRYTIFYYLIHDFQLPKWPTIKNHQVFYNFQELFRFTEFLIVFSMDFSNGISNHFKRVARNAVDLKVLPRKNGKNL